MRSLASWLPVAGVRGVRLSPGVGAGVLQTSGGVPRLDVPDGVAVEVLDPEGRRSPRGRPEAAGWLVCALPPLSHDAQWIRETGAPALAFAQPLSRLFAPRDPGEPPPRHGDPVIVDAEDGVLWTPMDRRVGGRWRTWFLQWPGEDVDPAGWRAFLRSMGGDRDGALAAFLLLVADRPEIPCRPRLLERWSELGIPAGGWEAAALMSLDRVQRKVAGIRDLLEKADAVGGRLERARELLESARDISGRLEPLRPWRSRAVEALRDAEGILERAERERIRSVREQLAAWRESRETAAPQALSRARALLRAGASLTQRDPDLQGELRRLRKWVQEAGQELWEASSHRLVRPFPCGADPDTELVGGKAALLAEAVPHLPPGLRVADGFVVTTAAWRAFLAGGPLADLEEAWKRRGPDLRALSRRCRAILLAAGFPAPLREAIEGAWTRMGGPRVVVRSSAAFEALGGAAGAPGLLDSFPEVRDAAELVRRVRDVWLSAWTPEVLALADARGWDPARTPVAVLVQRQVDAAWTGVAAFDETAPGRERVLVNLARGSWDAVTRGGSAGRVLLADLDPPFRIHPASPPGEDPEDGEEPPPEAEMRLLLELFRVLPPQLGFDPEVEFGLGDGACWLFQVRRRHARRPASQTPGA